MKNVKKWLAALLIAALCLVAVAGCVQTDSTAGGEDSEAVVAELTVGLPMDENSEGWADLKAMIEDFDFMDDAKVTVVTVPEVGTDEYKKFIDSVAKNRVDMFLSPMNDEINRLIEDGSIMSVTVMNGKDTRIIESLVNNFRKISRESNGANYMVPTNISYQGLFLNPDVFEAAGVEMPTDWDSLNAAIAALRDKGVTPFAAGFADGARYWIDEMILSEGGTAEHSSLPAKGVINSWQRAIDDLVAFYKAGAFDADATDTTHADAVAKFTGKQAAMIVANSTDMASADGAVFMPFPTAPTGIKKAGEMIAEASYGFYMNTKTMNRSVDDATTMSGIIIDFLGSDYLSNPDYYAPILSRAGMLPCNTAASSVLQSDADKAAFDALKAAPDADVPMARRMLTFDALEKGLGDVLRGNVKSSDYLLAASQAEIAAQAEKRAALANE